jgi:hypothetical protein
MNAYSEIENGVNLLSSDTGQQTGVDFMFRPLREKMSPVPFR